MAALAANTSPLVTRPSLPVPATEPTAKLLSAINLAAAGIATPAMEPLELLDTLVVGAATAATGVGTPALAAVSMRAINCSAATVPPSATKISTMTPADGAGTSSTTLSVSMSMRISSTATASPTFFFHCSMVASATDSDSWGTLTSTMVMLLFLSNSFGGGLPVPNYLVSTKPLSLANAPSTNDFCCS